MRAAHLMIRDTAILVQLFLVGDYSLLTLTAYNSTTVPPRPKVTYRTLIGSHTLVVDWYL